MDARVKTAIAVVVTVVWALSFLADIALGEAYSPSPYVHGMMMVVAGAAFGRSILSDKKEDQ